MMYVSSTCATAAPKGYSCPSTGLGTVRAAGDAEKFNALSGEPVSRAGAPISGIPASEVENRDTGPGCRPGSGPYAGTDTVSDTPGRIAASRGKPGSGKLRIPPRATGRDHASCNDERCCNSPGPGTLVPAAPASTRPRAPITSERTAAGSRNRNSV